PGDPGARGPPGTGDQQRVAASLEIAHRSLSSEAKRVLHLLGLLPTTELGTSVVVALTGTGEEAAERTLTELASGALVDPVGPERARWRVHELIWQFAAEKGARVEPGALGGGR